jgi:hypothetical protein
VEIDEHGWRVETPIGQEREHDLAFFVCEVRFPLSPSLYVTLEGVLDLLHAAGWVQPFPEAEPFAYESEVRDPGGNQNMSSVGVFAAADTDPIFGFAGWVEYFAGSAVVLQAAPSV